MLCHLTHGKKRTSDLKRLMPAITQKMLTQQLRELEEDGTGMNSPCAAFD